jgi:hypothetical protein
MTVQRLEKMPYLVLKAFILVVFAKIWHLLSPLLGKK